MAWLYNQLDFVYSKYILKLKAPRKCKHPHLRCSAVSVLLFQSGFIQVILRSLLLLAVLTFLEPKALSCMLELSPIGVNKE